VSCTVHVSCSIPQGSVLGPRLFIMYIADLEEKVDEHGVNYHAYADDMQLHLHCVCDDMPSAVEKLKHCITDINQWMSANHLRLNPEKTELLCSGYKHSLCRLGGCRPAIKLGTDTIKASGHVRVLRVTMSYNLSLERRLSCKCSLLYYLGRFVMSGNHWTLGQQQHSFMHLWH